MTSQAPTTLFADGIISDYSFNLKVDRFRFRLLIKKGLSANERPNITEISVH